MAKSLSFDTIFAALAVLSAGSAACTRAEHAAPAPETTTVTPAREPAASAVAPAPLATAAPVETAARALDAGKEMAPRAAPAKGASASCGAAGCSPDMKKK